MKLAEWLEHRAGLKGKKLEGAVKMCEDNWLETVEDLRVLTLEKNATQFKEVFPQGMLRTAILMALDEDPNEEPDDDKKVSSQIEDLAKEEASNWWVMFVRSSSSS